MATSNDRALSNLGKKIDFVPYVESMNFMGNEYCRDKVMNDSHVHVDSRSFLLFVYKTLGHSSETYGLREEVYPTHFSWLFRKNTPWKYKFDEGLQRLVEMGLPKKWYQDTMKERMKSNSTENEKALQLLCLQDPFISWGGSEENRTKALRI
ncbi:hypothetical protein SK128_013341 [Halocaridina rubra]|uniref:Uncharacterized protein n=1 Tax=Halocaridina rubra TaxID=373956 RepID=A0AAN8XAN4_HALRR